MLSICQHSVFLHPKQSAGFLLHYIAHNDMHKFCTIYSHFKRKHNIFQGLGGQKHGCTLPMNVKIVPDLSHVSNIASCAILFVTLLGVRGVSLDLNLFSTHHVMNKLMLVNLGMMTACEHSIFSRLSSYLATFARNMLCYIGSTWGFR